METKHDRSSGGGDQESLDSSGAHRHGAAVGGGRRRTCGKRGTGLARVRAGGALSAAAVAWRAGGIESGWGGGEWRQGARAARANVLVLASPIREGYVAHGDGGGRQLSTIGQIDGTAICSHASRYP